MLRSLSPQRSVMRSGWTQEAKVELGSLAVQVEVCAERLYLRPRKGKEHEVKLTQTERVKMLELEELLRTLREQCKDDEGF